MLEYRRLARDRRKLRALTGWTRRECQTLLPAVVAASQSSYAGDKTLAGRKRKRQGGGGGVGKLRRAEPKLRFIVVYPKAPPRQGVLGEWLEWRHASANEWRPRLWPVLREALRALGGMPERRGRHVARADRGTREPAAYRLEGTARRRPRPKKPANQALHSSGQKKMPRDKNGLLVHPRAQRGGSLRPTSAGKPQAQKVAECEQMAYPRHASRPKDTGFQGYAPPVKHAYPPPKSRAAPT